MSSPYTLYATSDEPSATAIESLTRALGANVARLWPATDEDVEDALEFTGVEPTVTGLVRASEPGGDGALFLAVLEWARARPGSAAVIQLDDTTLMLYARGTLFPPESERAFFEAEVLPRYDGPVVWPA